MKKVRIALVAPQPFVETRGTPMANLRTAQILADAGYVVDVITFPFGTHTDYPGIRVLRCPRVKFINSVKIGFSLGKVLTDASLALKVMYEANRNRYDVIHGVEEGGLIGYVVSRFIGARLVFDMDSVMSQEISYSKLGKIPGFPSLVRATERFLVHKADLIVTICDSMADYVRSIDARKDVVVVPDIPLQTKPGCANEEDVWSRIPGNPKRKLVVYTGSLAKYQGLDLLISAMKRVVAVFPEALLVVVGGGDKEIEELSTFAKHVGVMNNTLFLGTKPPDEIPRFLSAANVLVSPRRSGINTPAKLYTYMESGTPIVATDIPAHRAVVDGEAAILVPASPDCIAEGIIQALSDSATGARIAARARDIVSSITPKLQAERLLDGYQRLTAKMIGRK